MSSTRLEILRYGATMVLGLLVDIATAFLAATVFGISLTVASALGVAAGAVFNFIVLKLWAFGDARPGRAAPLRYLAAVAATMAVRSGTVWMLDLALPVATPPLVILCSAIAVSFFVNFLLSKYWVFHHNMTGS